MNEHEQHHHRFVTTIFQEGLPGVFSSVAFQREWIDEKILSNGGGNFCDTQEPPTKVTQEPPIRVTQEPPIRVTQEPPIRVTLEPPIRVTREPPTQEPPTTVTQEPPTKEPPTTVTQEPMTGVTVSTCSLKDPGELKMLEIPGCGGWVDLSCDKGCLNIQKVIKHYKGKRMK